MTSFAARRATISRLNAYQAMFDADHILLCDQVEPLLYRRLKDQARRRKQVFDYATRLDGITFVESFDENLGTRGRRRLARGVFTIALKMTSMFRGDLYWFAKGVEERINHRLGEDSTHYVRVDVIKLKRAITTAKQRSKEWTFKFTTEQKPEAKLQEIRQRMAEKALKAAAIVKP